MPNMSPLMPLTACQFRRHQPDRCRRLAGNIFYCMEQCFFNQKLPTNGNFLVHGGAGGIGSTAIQLGAAMGLSVYTTARNSASCDYCESLGAHRAINLNDEDFVSILREEGGADIILDIIGGDYIARNIKAARHDARIIQLAFNAGSRVEIDLMPVMLKRLSFTGSTLRSRPDQFKAEVAADLRSSGMATIRQRGPSFACNHICQLPDDRSLQSPRIDGV